MLPVFPNTDRIPLWFWLLAVVAFIGVALLVSSPDFDVHAAGLRLRQGIALAILGGGLFWIWHGGRTLWRLRALMRHSMDGVAEITELKASSQRVKRSGPFAVGTTTLTQHFLAYRFKHQFGEASVGPMRIDRDLAVSLEGAKRLKVRYLTNRPQVSAPAGIAVRQVQAFRAMQLAAGLALAIWAVGWLAPGVLWGPG